jgi:serine/threonine protein kinase
MNEQDIYIEAMNRQDAADRRRFLDQACGENRVLRDRVEKLIQHTDRVGNFLEHPPEPLVVAAEPAFDADVLGTQIGPYKLLEQIGEGGFGVVYLAEQERPVRRKVALKIIKPGMDTRQVIARFEAERQALAMMDHPNIAKVLDAGTTGGELPRSSIQHPASSIQTTGRPYFVMELVQGVPITEYCDQCHLTTNERLKLFITVCQAVQHAHQKGIIHRDLKPTNVLVAMQDGQAAPKIIDFGVAKAIDQQLTEHTLTTAFAQMVGTPLYMSPEQAELSPLGVDTRSDIYSLGVMLYELLTGATPFDKDRLHAAGYDELRRIIREEEPPPPSARISTFAADKVSTVAEHRRTDACHLGQQVRGELDWIVMKCLEKDRNRRYDSAGSLAQDVERYLHDEPVQACPPSTVYRLRKYARRNKVALAFVTLLVGGLVYLAYSNLAIERERDAKTTALARAQVVSDLLHEMLASADSDGTKGRNYTVRELLDDSSAMLGNQLDGLPDAEADIRATIGSAYRSLGMNELAQPHLKRALELARQVHGPEHERLAAILVDYAWNLEHQDRYSEAEPYLHEAIDIYRNRGITGNELFRALRVLQDLLISARRYDEAERVTRDAMAIPSGDQEFADFASILHQYADMQFQLGNFAKAEEIAQRAVQMHRRIHGDNRDTAYAMSKLAFALEAQNKLEQAEKTLSESLTILRRFYDEDRPNVRNMIERQKAIAKAREQQKQGR